MKSQNLKEVFEHFKEYILQSLKIVVVHKLMREEEFVLEIEKWMEFIGELEDRNYKINFEELEKIASDLEYDLTRILKWAQFSKEKKGISNEEMLEELLEQIEYRIFKEEKKGGEQ